MSNSLTLLEQALPGNEVSKVLKKWKFPEIPWKFWKSQDSVWAVYLSVGNRLSSGVIESVKLVKCKGLNCVILAEKADALMAVADHYPILDCSIICEIGGLGRIIPPFKMTLKKTNPQKNITRIQIGLISEICGRDTNLHRHHLRLIKGLLKKYTESFSGSVANDEKEKKLLTDYATKVIKGMGFIPPNLSAPTMIRRLDASGWGGRRDHFFHSFQNYFFGLLAITKLNDYFNLYKTTAKIHWDVDPIDIWFLTALWHDVGYGIENFEDVTADLVGPEHAVDIADFAKTKLLLEPGTREAFKNISSLIKRLMGPSRARTEWMLPSTKQKRSREEVNICNALSENFAHDGHGAASALRLYNDFMPKVNRMATETQHLLKQAVLLSCCSMPFHDHHFREYMRTMCGSCIISTDVMPFAGLLAFIDSIQDDRRDLSGLLEEINFLDKILISEPANVHADVNHNAIPPASLLWKIVEARDVHSSLCQQTNQLTFIYPTWMVA